MSTLASSLVTEVQRWVPDCDDATALAAINLELQETADLLPLNPGTHTFTTVSGTQEYNIAAGAAYGHATRSIKRIYRSRYDTAGSNIKIPDYLSFAMLEAQMPEWDRESSGTPRMLVQRGKDLIWLVPAPSAAVIVKLWVDFDLANMVSADTVTGIPDNRVNVLAYGGIRRVAKQFDREDLFPIIMPFYKEEKDKLLMYFQDLMPIEYDIPIRFSYR